MADFNWQAFFLFWLIVAMGVVAAIALCAAAEYLRRRTGSDVLVAGIVFGPLLLAGSVLLGFVV